MPHFGILSEDTARLAGSELIMFAPIVKKADKAAWEVFASTHTDWIQQDQVNNDLNAIGPNVPIVLFLWYDFYSHITLLLV